MSSSVIDKVNQIGFAKGRISLLTFYYHKVNPIQYNDTNIAGVDEDPEIIGVDN